MASVWKKTMLYLGLGPDEEYDDYGAYADGPEPAPPRRQAPGPARGESVPSDAHAGEGRRSVQSRPVRPVAADVPPPRGGQRSTERGSRNDLLDDDASGTVRPIRAESDSRTVRPVSQTTQAKPFVLTPTGFNDAQSVGDRFKAKQPVIVNLQAADRDLARRLIDFASGLCYGLGGQMEKVATQVYLLTPADVELSAEARRQIVERRGSPAADS